VTNAHKLSFEIAPQLISRHRSERQPAAWKKAHGRHIRRSRDVEAFQRFQDYAELEARLANQGPKSLARISTLRGQTATSIPIPYRLALL